MATTESIEVRDLGPVERVSIPLPEGGGITVLRGRNDCGKSLTLAAAQKLAGSEHKIGRRDGAEDPGSIEGLGVTITAGRSTRRSGELEALSIEGKLSIAELIDPGLKDAEAADRARTKALCRLLGVEAKAELFHEAAGGIDRFRQFVSIHAIQPDDIVEMQRRIKADLDKAARDMENAAAKMDGEHAALKSAGEGLDLEAEDDSTVLQFALEQALKAEAALRQRKLDAEQRTARAAEATSKIEAAKASYAGPTLEEAEHEKTETFQVLQDAIAATDAARKAYQAAQAAEDKAATRHELAKESHVSTLRHFQTIDAWQQTITDGEGAKGPSNHALQTATVEVNQARAAIEQGALIREAKRKLDLAAQVNAHGKQCRSDAEKLRNAAKDTELVLAEVVECDQLTLEDGRWMTQHPTRGPVPYHDRSRGTRAIIALELAVTRLRATGNGKALIPFPQEVWEGLDFENRQRLLKRAVQLRVNLITAEADREAADGQGNNIRAEVYR